MYGRIIDGEELTLRASGWTYGDVFVLYDEQSESLWFPNDEGLQCIQGKHFEKVLPRLPAQDTTWREWQAEHPASSLLR